MRSVLLVRGGTTAIDRNSGAPIPFDIYPVFESADVVIDRAFRICMLVVLGGRDLMV
jgi:hypothetical protein